MKIFLKLDFLKIKFNLNLVYLIYIIIILYYLYFLIFKFILI